MLHYVLLNHIVIPKKREIPVSCEENYDYRDQRILQGDEKVILIKPSHSIMISKIVQHPS